MKYLIHILCLVVLLGIGSCIDKDPKFTQLEKDLKVIDDYIISNGLASSTIILPSNTRMIVNHFDNSTGLAKVGQIVDVDVTGKLFSDQSVFFDQNINQKVETILPDGLKEGIANILGGTSITLYVPSQSGYGTAGTTGVPPNSVLIYEITLNDIVKTSAQETQFEIDTTAIKDYLTDNSITATKQEAGIWYTIETAGAGKSPTPYDYVSFDFVLRDLANDGEIIEQGSLQQQPIFGLIDGLKIGFPEIENGTTATFYIPSLYAYGPIGQGSIGANKNLIFEIKLTEVF